MKRLTRQSDSASRRGSLMPMLAVAILVICCAGALVLDRLWIDAAQVQLTAAAEAASLAAAGRLADDDRLREPYDAARHIDAARQAADRIARRNLVAGRPVELDLGEQGDIRFGQIVESPTTGDPVFLETDVDPTSVWVIAQSLRERGNPILTFFCGVTGQTAGDAQGAAEATIDNHVIGIRPLPGSSVPALPLGILETDPTGKQENTWEKQIDRREGQDLYGFDSNTGTLMLEADGIPEIILTVDTSDAEEETDSTNVTLLDLGTRLHKPHVREQIADGLTEYDMQAFNGELILSGYRVAIDGSTTLVGECLSDFEQQIGKTRICLLYQDDSKGNEYGVGRTFATRLVAIRILAVQTDDTGATQIIVQPSVITTRSAVLTYDQSLTNPYIYKLYLTH